MIDELDEKVINLIQTVNERTLSRMREPYQVAAKTSFKDLVTSVDKENERYLDGQLRLIDPGCQILSEEGFGNRQVGSLQGHVWIVDPIDGTLNFVKQHNNFGIMLALYIDGRPTLGYIMDCRGGCLYHGGPGRGVWANEHQLDSPADISLHEGLVAISSPLILDDVNNVAAVARHASGLRMYGSAAKELIGVLTGELAGYISYLRPWDLAAGRVLATELGLTVKCIDGTTPNVLSFNLVLVATQQASRDVFKLVG